MVTLAGKELLKNTINTVKLHNRILEENEMWRHWNLQKGLTMMVSDDMFRGEKSVSDDGLGIEKKKRKKKKKKKHKEKHKRDKYKSRESSHSYRNGYMKFADSSADRWDHSGFAELYPESKSEVSCLKTVSPELKRSFKDDVKKCMPSASNASLSIYSDSSDSKEVWKSFRSKKRKHRDLSTDRVPKSKKCDNDDSDHRVGKHKSVTACRKLEDCKQNGSRHHHKYEKKAKDITFKS